MRHQKLGSEIYEQWLCTWLTTSRGAQTRSWCGVQVWVSRGSNSVRQVLMACSTATTAGAGATASTTGTTASTTGATVSTTEMGSAIATGATASGTTSTTS